MLQRIILIALLQAAANAGTIALTFTTSPTTFTAGFDATRGWQFTVTSPILVTELGMWDATGTGLADAHTVGIWDSGSNLLGSLVIPSGTSAALDGPDKFRFVNLSIPFLLSPGTYRIGATFLNGDPDLAAREVGPATASGITYVSPQFSPGPGFADPTNPSANVQGIFGPNFEFVAASVPEPGTWTMLLTAVGLLAIRRNISPPRKVIGSA